MIIQQMPGPTASAPLPQPLAPGLGTGAQIVKETAAGSTNRMPAPDAEASKKTKLAAERERLNHNALLWQIERAQGGSATAMRSIGMRYLTGDGLEKDEAKARDWLQKGADGGDSAAIKELARLKARKELEQK